MSQPTEAIQPRYTPDGLQTLPQPKPDLIFQTGRRFETACIDNPLAVNCSIGMIMDEETGRARVFDVVEETYREVVSEGVVGYQSQVGHIPYLDEYGSFLFGGVWENLSRTRAENLDDQSGIVRPDTAVWIQTPGGTPANFLARRAYEMLSSTRRPAMLLDDGWPNHRKIFGGLDIRSYRHEDPVTRKYNHSGFMQQMEELPPGSLVHMQLCGYNGDGADRTFEEWIEVAQAIEERHAIASFDAAYNGLADGFETDHLPLAFFMSRGIPMFVSSSRSKNFASYSRRLGSYYALNFDPEVASRLQGNLESYNIDDATEGEFDVRMTWSNPPFEIAEAAFRVQRDESKLTRYRSLVAEVRNGTLNKNRLVMSEVLGPEFSWIRDRKGLYVQLLPNGFSDRQMAFLEGKGIYGIKGSRINLGGLPPSRIEEIAHHYREALQLS